MWSRSFRILEVATLAMALLWKSPGLHKVLLSVWCLGSCQVVNVLSTHGNRQRNVIGPSGRRRRLAIRRILRWVAEHRRSINMSLAWPVNPWLIGRMAQGVVTGWFAEVVVVVASRLQVTLLCRTNVRSLPSVIDASAVGTHGKAGIRTAAGVKTSARIAWWLPLHHILFTFWRFNDLCIQVLRIATWAQRGSSGRWISTLDIFLRAPGAITLWIAFITVVLWVMRVIQSIISRLLPHRDSLRISLNNITWWHIGISWICNKISRVWWISSKFTVIYVCTGWWITESGLLFVIGFWREILVRKTPQVGTGMQRPMKLTNIYLIIDVNYKKFSSCIEAGAVQLLHDSAYYTEPSLFIEIKTVHSK